MLTRCKNRSFSTSYYASNSKVGLSIPVTWLAYSHIHCEPCWLFADREMIHIITLHGQLGSVTGVNSHRKLRYMQWCTSSGKDPVPWLISQL